MSKTNKEKVIERAEQKILANIYYIYENVNVEKEIKKIRDKFLITDYYFTDLKVPEHPKYYPAKISGHFDDISSILFSTIIAWTDISLRNKNKLDQIIKNFGQKKYKIWLKEATRQGIKKNLKINFVFNEILKYFTNQNTGDIDKPMRLNPKIWGSIIVAKIFEIPPETIIKSMKSILNNYFPSVDETMKIQFNELTSTEDIKHIWSEVKKQQDAYSKNLGIIQKGPYINHDVSKRAFEIKTDFPEISRQEIIDSLRNEGYDADISPDYLTIMLRKYRKFINQ